MIAVQHSIKPADLRARLLHELGSLKKGLGLEALIQDRKQKLDELEQAITKAIGVLETTKGVVNSLKQEKTKLEASIKEIREHIGQEIAKIIPLARDTINHLADELRSGVGDAIAGVNQVRDESLEVGKQVGRYQGMLETNAWLNELLALVRGEESIEARRVRVIALSVARGVRFWLRVQDKPSAISTSLFIATDNLIKDLEQWKI